VSTAVPYSSAAMLGWKMWALGCVEFGGVMENLRSRPCP
jgi:hypothetical protein